MKGHIALLSVLCFLLAGLSEASAQETVELIRGGDAAYLKRSEDPAAVKEAIAKWEKASTSNPKDTECLYKIAMAYCFLARFEPKPDASFLLYEKGHEYAQKAVENDGKSGPAHFWWAFTLAKSIEPKSKFAKLAVLGDISLHLQLAKSLDPNYQFGGPDRVLGYVALKSPIPNVKLAIEHLRACVSLAPDYSANLLFLAQALIKDQNPEEGKKLLTKVMGLRPLPGFRKELEDDQKAAAELLKTIEQ